MISGDITTPFAEDGQGGMFFVTSLGLYHCRMESPSAFRSKLLRPICPSLSIVTPANVSGSHHGHLVQLVPRKLGSNNSPLFDPVIRATITSPVTVLLSDAQEVSGLALAGRDLASRLRRAYPLELP